MGVQLDGKNDLCSMLRKNDEQLLNDVGYLRQALNKLRFEGRLHLKKNVARTSSALNILNERLLSHSDEEENILIPFSVGRLPHLEPVQHLFFAEHKEFMDKTKNILTLLKRLESDKYAAMIGTIIHQIYSEGTYLTCFVTSHLKIESSGLYKVIENRLKANDKKKLSDLLILNT